MVTIEAVMLSAAEHLSAIFMDLPSIVDNYEKKMKWSIHMSRVVLFCQVPNSSRQEIPLRSRDPIYCVRQRIASPEVLEQANQVDTQWYRYVHC